ncbi:IS66 family insertion sequence element accessory protein TnpA [Sorangium sp. So ce321]|uniref:IS66 family insertion sequence element accessory protein TnpA n=1 Tax=Sorangium sp. So ce321 TaxID=3133300 RepID=UPI003F6286BF
MLLRSWVEVRARRCPSGFLLANVWARSARYARARHRVRPSSRPFARIRPAKGIVTVRAAPVTSPLAKEEGMATRVEWAERVERWERSGLSAESFARREGYKHKQLYWWRWKLRADGASQLSPPSSTEPPRFLPVHVVADVSPVVTEPIEIALPNGRDSTPPRSSACWRWRPRRRRADAAAVGARLRRGGAG